MTKEKGNTNASYAEGAANVPSGTTSCSLFSAEALSSQLGISRATLLKWVKMGYVESVAVGKKHLYKVDNIESLGVVAAKAADISSLEEQLRGDIASIGELADSYRKLTRNTPMKRRFIRGLNLWSRVIGMELADRDKEMMDMFFRGERIDEIAARFSMSCAGVANIIDKAMDYIGTLGDYAALYERYKIMSSECDRLSAENNVLSGMLRSLQSSLCSPESSDVVERELSRPIDTLGISVRASNACARNNVKIVYDIVILTRDQFKSYKSVGESVVVEIENALAVLSERCGTTLTFGMSIPSLIKK